MNISVAAGRFFCNVSRGSDDECWEWVGEKNRNGYGAFRVSGKNFPAHRFSLLISGVELIPGLVCDHLCRNRACVNPRHIRQVTQRENTFAAGSVATAKLNAMKTHCPKGHEYSPENTYTGNGHRNCRLCENKRRRERWRTKYATDPEFRAKHLDRCKRQYQVVRALKGEPK